MNEPDLAAWLLEQIAVDERRARDVGAEGLAGAVLPGQGGRVPGPRWDAQHGIVADVRDQLPLWKVDGVPWAKYATSSFVAEHMAAWDPARVLAECEAKRRVISLCQLDFNDDDEPIFLGGYGEAYWDTLRLIALPYVDRPGYREEWRL